ncbi:MAG: AI-2E family transporter [Eubacteriales bacterium]|nr:AI-2E family transporter [Eubacteriales bacterium]
MELHKGNMKKIMYLITFAVLLYVGVQNLGIVLDFIGVIWGLSFPFILGGAIAFVLNVPMKFAEKHLFERAKKKGNKAARNLARPVSLVLAILLVVVIILVVVLVVAPELGNTIVSVAKKIEESIPKLQDWIEHTFSSNPMIIQWANSIDFQTEKMLNSALSVLKSGVDNILSSTISVTMGILSTAMNVGIGFIFACYVLLQKERLIVQVKKALYAMFPKKGVETAGHVFSLANRTFANFITGQCIEAVILGSMFFVTMTVFKFPYALLVGVLISFTALIPVFGGIIGCWIGFFLILMVSPMQAVMFLILFLVLQQIEGNLIYPHVVGNSVGLPSIWVLVAVTMGGSLMGVVGMLVFIPLVSVIYSLFREWACKRLEEKKIQVEPRAAETEESR